jgi:hypothetical protein
MNEIAGSDRDLRPGDRVYCKMLKPQHGYFIRDEGEFAYVMWDNGGQGSTRKTFLFATAEEVAPPIRRLCESIELHMRRDGFAIRDNARLEAENRTLEAEVEVCADMVMDLMAGKTVTYELEVGEKKVLELPVSGRERPLDKESTWDKCMFLGAMRKKAEKLIRIRDIEEYEKEMMDEEVGEDEEDEDQS